MTLSDKVMDALDRGLYGSPEIKPEERNIFLTTIIERIYLALTKNQVIHKGMYDEVVRLFAEKRDIHLYINGNLTYNNYANYIKEANKNNVRFTIVSADKKTPFGLVVATDNKAINQQDIFIKDKFYQSQMEQ
jgi:uncharacterized protein YueI